MPSDRYDRRDHRSRDSDRRERSDRDSERYRERDSSRSKDKKRDRDSHAEHNRPEKKARYKRAAVGFHFANMYPGGLQ